MTKLIPFARKAGCSIWAFVSPTESDFDVCHSTSFSIAQTRKTSYLSISNGARIFKHTLAAVSLLAGLFFVTAGTLIIPSSISLILGGSALTCSIGCYICMLRQNQSQYGRGLPYCGAKPLHINLSKNPLDSCRTENTDS